MKWISRIMFIILLIINDMNDRNEWLLIRLN